MRYDKAYSFAKEKHKGQKYGIKDYMYHINGVVQRLQALAKRVDDGFVSVEKIEIAILHDTLEDTNTTYAELVSNFGVNVANGVKALTRGPDESLEEYIAKIKAHRVADVKLADALFNLEESIAFGQRQRIEKYLKTIELLSDGFAGFEDLK